MHRHNALCWQQIIEDPEHALLHFTGVFGPTDQDQLLGEVYRDPRFRIRAVTRWVRLEAGQINNGVFGREISQLAYLRPNQQRANEKIVPSQFVDDAHVDAVFGLRTAKQVRNIKGLFFPKRGQKVLFVRADMVWCL